MAARSAQPARPRSCTSVTARYWSPTAPLPRRRSRSAATASSSAPTGTRPSGSRPDIRWRGPPGSRCDPTGTRPGITDGPAAPSGRNINGVKSVLLAMQNESRLAVADADIVVLAIPLHRWTDVDPARLAGKVVIDAMNYWPASDGVLTAFENDATGSSEIVAGRLVGSAVVKALNHIGYHELEDRARPSGAPDRRASGLAGDDPAAVAAVAELTDRIGYDPVRLGG